MQARDASGRQVSLLNDDNGQDSIRQGLGCRTASHTVYKQSQPQLTRSDSSSPATPELLRSDSYDSHMTGEPLTPLSPVYDYASPYSATAQDGRSPYDDYMGETNLYATTYPAKRPCALIDSRSSSYEDDAVTSSGVPALVNERSGKRYLCRYRDTHGCEKTFTTSGHASRHSKIHTAEKAVPCAHPGCSKKFTRADNMKQHLETHYKDKSRPLAVRPSLSSERRSSSSRSISHANRKAASVARHGSPLPSPGGVWDLRGFTLPLLSRPNAARTPSGLDTLAMAIAVQDGA